MEVTLAVFHVSTQRGWVGILTVGPPLVGGDAFASPAQTSCQPTKHPQGTFMELSWTRYKELIAS
jgi:hypothetical protein